jgi:hypothetical protein
MTLENTLRELYGILSSFYNEVTSEEKREEYRKFKEAEDQVRALKKARCDAYDIEINGNKVTVNDSFTYEVKEEGDAEYLEGALRKTIEEDCNNEIPENTESEWAIVIDDEHGVYLHMEFFDTKESMIESINPSELAMDSVYVTLVFNRGKEVSLKTEMWVEE